METRKKILLTGASGVIGLAVLKQLHTLRDSYETTVFDFKSKKTINKLKPYKDDVNIVYGDITSKHDLFGATQNMDIVIHLASIKPPLANEAPDLAFQVNVKGTQTLVNCLEEYSPDAFLLYSSSIAVYGDRLNTPMISVSDKLDISIKDEYAETKIAAEEIVENSRLEWAIFRPATIMSGLSFSKLMFHQPLKTSLEIVTPEDAARAFVNAIEMQSKLSKKTFNLGGGESCRMLYEDFLNKSFEIIGLEKLDFPLKTFAEKNFYGGYYADGDKLEDILHFRRDSFLDYFETQKKNISPAKKRLNHTFRKAIKIYLQSQSEPLRAYVNHEEEAIDYFFVRKTNKDK